jgi:mannose-6-phosphate isomerase-like protein (cupin superfamily)
MRGYKDNIEKVTLANSFFRNVLYTAKNCQLVVMNLKQREEIGMEVHDVDQFFRVEKGHGKLIIDANEYSLEDGDAMVVPSGSSHNIINVSDSEDLKLYTLYCPPHHKDGIVHRDKEEAEKDNEEYDGKTSE